MNTLKKTVAVVLAVAMVLTMGIATSFAAFTDVQSTAGYAEAVNILTNLGIITGYEDGSFKPNNTITRAEVAAIMVRVLNADPTPGVTPFADVPADHWASGYINTAYSLGIINGYGDGNFGPGANVLYEQAVKMIVCALGYEPQANGNYPTGYLNIASSKDITNGSNGTVGQPATRATVAKLVYNALEVPMMEPVEFGSAPKYSAQDDSKTLLSKLGVEKLEVVVDSTYYTSAAENGYDSRDRLVTLVSNKNNQVYDGDEDLDKGVKIGDFEEGGTAAGSMLGYACVAYVGDDDETGDPTIFAITAKGSKNSVTTVNGDRLATDDELSDTEADKNVDGTVYYWKNGRTDRRPASVSPDSDGIKVYINYLEDGSFDYVKKGDSANTPGTKFYDTLYNGDFKKGGLVEFIDNDADGDYNVALISVYSQEGVVDTVRTVDGVYSFRKIEGAGSLPEQYDPEDDEKLKLFVKGEAYIDPSEIAHGDTITTIGDEDNDNIIIYLVSSDSVEGRSTTYDPEEDTLTIAGKAYSKSPAYKEELSSFKNTNGTFYFNADGLLSFVDGSSAATGDYGYVVGSLLDESWKSSYEIKIVDANGRPNTYKLKSENITVYGNWNDDPNYVEGRSQKVDAEDIHGVFDIDGADIDPMDRIVKYSVSNGEVNRIVFVNKYQEEIDVDGDRDTIENPDDKYDVEEHTIGSSEALNENTIVFVVGKDDDGNPVYDDEDYITVTKGYSKFVDGNEYGVATFMENNSVVAALQVSSDSKVARDQHVFVVTNVTTDINEDDENVVTFTGIQDGTTTSFDLYDDDDGYADSIGDGDLALGKGSVLLVGPVDNGFVDKIEILVSVTRDGRSLDAISGDSYAASENNGDDIISGLAVLNSYYDDKEDADVYVNGSGYIQVEGYTGANDKGYKPAASTNIVVADFTGRSFSAATVRTRDDLGDLEVNDVTDYAFAVFFRAYEVKDPAVTDLYTNRTKVQDLVFYKVDDPAYFNIDGDAPAQDWSSYDDNDYEDNDILDAEDEDEAEIITPDESF